MARHPSQSHTLVVLAIAQALGGVANGVALGVGSLLVEQVTGEASLAGLAATLLTLGGAVLAVPLARLAQRKGRRIALTTGASIGFAGTLLLAIGGTLGAAWIVLPGFLALGASMAVNLQSRFAATDLAAPAHRGRDLSLVVWMTTIGVVVGPNLVAAGDALGTFLGLPHLVGAYVISGSAQLVTTLVLWAFLRPDPLLLALAAAPADPDRPTPRVRLSEHPRAIVAIVIVAATHATMVGVMALTPVHLGHAGASLASIGLTMSAHTAGMYALSPVFGALSDRWGRTSVVLVGALLLAAAIVTNLVLPPEWAPVPLALLGLGWSAGSVAGSAAVAESVEAPLRPLVQGRADLVLGLAGASAGAIAGPLLAIGGYALLNVAMGAFVVVLVVAALALRSPVIVQGSSRQVASQPRSVAVDRTRHREDPS